MTPARHEGAPDAARELCRGRRRASPWHHRVRARAISDEVEAEIRRVYPHAEVIIHEDPAGVAKLRSALD